MVTQTGRRRNGESWGLVLQRISWADIRAGGGQGLVQLHLLTGLKSSRGKPMSMPTHSLALEAGPVSAFLSLITIKKIYISQMLEHTTKLSPAEKWLFKISVVVYHTR